MTSPGEYVTTRTTRY